MKKNKKQMEVNYFYNGAGEKMMIDKNKLTLNELIEGAWMTLLLISKDMQLENKEIILKDKSDNNVRVRLVH